MTGDPFRRYRDDPVAFVEEVLGVHLYSRQREIVEAVRDHERVAVKSGNATGKTTSAACVILAWLAGGPGSVVVSTSQRSCFLGDGGAASQRPLARDTPPLQAGARLLRRRGRHRHRDPAQG